MARTLPGLVLLHADSRSATSWVEHGVTPSYVVPLGGWTGVVPAGPAQAKPPYDQALTVVAGRPVPWRMRPGIGLFVIDERAVLTVHARGLRALSRWLVWQPDRGMSPVPGLPEAHVADFVRAAGVVRDAEVRVRAALHERVGTPMGLLATVLDALALPGIELLKGVGVKENPEATLVEPDPASIERFDKVTGDEIDMRRELEENS